MISCSKNESIIFSQLCGMPFCTHTRSVLPRQRLCIVTWTSISFYLFSKIESIIFFFTIRLSIIYLTGLICEGKEKGTINNVDRLLWEGKIQSIVLFSVTSDEKSSFEFILKFFQFYIKYINSSPMLSQALSLSLSLKENKKLQWLLFETIYGS